MRAATAARVDGQRTVAAVVDEAREACDKPSAAVGTNEPFGGSLAELQAHLDALPAAEAGTAKRHRREIDHAQLRGAGSRRSNGNQRGDEGGERDSHTASMPRGRRNGGPSNERSVWPVTASR